jgi:oxygen-dependent protoporphyrinogen oxidase
VRRRAGKEAAHILADALVTGIYAGDPKLLSLPATFPRLAQWEKEYGSLIKGMVQTTLRRRKNGILLKRPAGQRTTRMWSFRQGLRVLIESLCAHLQKPPLMGISAQRLAENSARPTSSWMVFGNGKEQWPADAVILACPAYQQAAILGDLDSELAERVGQIAYNRLAVVALGYRRADVPGRLDGFGYIAPQHTRRDLLGVQWCSSIFPDRASADTVLLRAMCGGWSRPELAGWDDPRLLEAVRAELRLTMGITASPIFHRIIRWDRAIPQYHIGHLERVAWIEGRLAGHPGLFLAGNAYHGVALNDCTEQAELVAARVRQFLAASSN